MKKQLLITILTAAFSSTAFSAETPEINHAEELHRLIQQGETEDGKKCPGLTKRLSELKAILKNGQQRLEETGVFNWTDEEKKIIETCSIAHNSASATDIPEKIATEETSAQ